MLAWLDVVEEHLVDGSHSHGRDGPQHLGGLARIAARDSVAPQLRPVGDNRGGVRRREPLGQAQDVEGWMADEGIAPVDDRPVVGRATYVARVQISVDEGVW